MKMEIYEMIVLDFWSKNGIDVMARKYFKKMECL